MLAVARTPLPVRADEPLRIGSRLQLFVDDYVIDTLSGDAQLHLHRPEPQEVVLTTDALWEGNTSAYYTVFRDDDIYRMYYRGSHSASEGKRAAHREVTCYAESSDGIHWTKPNLGLHEFDGSKDNNIVWDGIGTHCFTVFKDDNPNCAPEARYKAISRGRPKGKKGLYVFQSPDGIQWSLIKDQPVITTGAFDSQNLAFWDSETEQYREYHRSFQNGVRSIMTSTSEDFVNWTDPVPLKYGDAPQEHLYTNAVLPYFRAPQIYLGFPTRYLPQEGQRVEPTLMASHDGVHFKRWLDALIPEDAPEDRDGNRSNYMTWGVVQLPDNEHELSVYATEAYYTGPDSRLRRFTWRTDGFVSLRGGTEGGALTTPPVIPSGEELILNFVAQAPGTVRVELQTADGDPIPGFALADCPPLQGDSLDQPVRWKNRSLADLDQQPIRVCIHVRCADVYAFRFR